MEIQHKKDNAKGEFYIEENNTKIAEMTYRKSDKKIMTINHTYVDKAYRNQGTASKLVRSAVDYARENSFKIVPICEFAVAEFERNESYQDVLK